MQMMLHQPADTALQVAGGIYQSEGMAGFWRGNGESELQFPQLLYRHPRFS